MQLPAGNMPQAVKSNLLLYADDSINIKTLEILKKYLMRTLKISVTGFLLTKVSIHFRDDKTKLIFSQVSEGRKIFVN